MQSILSELDTRLLILNKTPLSNMEVVSQLNLIVAVITDIHTESTELTTGVLGFKESVNALYEYTRVLVSCLANHLIVPLGELRTNLVHVKQDMKAYSRLEIPKIWMKTSVEKHQLSLMTFSS